MKSSIIKNKKKNIIKKPELLAPAGDLERLKVALLYGADAVYIGGVLFGLRANASNFTIKEIEEGVLFAHNLNKKVYVTVNIAFHSKELKQVLEYLKELDRIKVDAIIISDPSIISIVKNNTNLEVHLSTQQSTLNYEAVAFWKEKGINRIVMAREVSKEDLNLIMNKVDIEIECFIHGAMCASYSGRCALSNYFTNRDANRGGCSQICRWDFSLLDENKNLLKGDKPFTFCTKDLSMLEYINEMIDMGITSFKIEGRMRSSYYIATVVSVYRKVIDNYCDHKNKCSYNKKDEEVLKNCANREVAPQFFNNIYDSSCQYYNGREEYCNQDFIGTVLSYDTKTKYAIIEQRNYFGINDEVEIFGPKRQSFTIKIKEILDEDNNKIEVVRCPKQVVKIKVGKDIFAGDMIRKKKS